jgi:hypothetical protein
MIFNFKVCKLKHVQFSAIPRIYASFGTPYTLLSSTRCNDVAFYALTDKDLTFFEYMGRIFRGLFSIFFFSKRQSNWKSRSSTMDGSHFHIRRRDIYGWYPILGRFKKTCRRFILVLAVISWYFYTIKPFLGADIFVLTVDCSAKATPI